MFRHFSIFIMVLFAHLPWNLERIHNKRIKIRQSKYMNNIVEQDHWHIKRISRSMTGFKNFHATQKTRAGIELMIILKTSQMKKNLGRETYHR